MSRPALVEADVASAYRDYTRAQWLRFSLISSVIAASLIPIFSVLDFMIYPEWGERFLVLRLSCTVLIMVLASVVSRRLRAHVKGVTVALFLMIQVMILVMILVTDGAASTYYAGLNLTVIAMGLLLPTRVGETLGFCVVTYLGYWLACAANATSAMGVDFLGNLFFLVSTGTIASLSSHFLGTRRYSEFLLSYQLELRNRELADLDRQKTIFFANVSHELRTPLTLILAPVQDLLEGREQLSERVRARLQAVRDNALRLLKLVNDLLDVIRLEEGHETLQSRPVDVDRLLGGLVEAMTHLAATKGLRVVADLAAGPQLVLGDLRALEKVFVNLIANAIKFTDADGVIRVTSRSQDGRVIVAVQDNGIGIAKADQAHIFERFRQADGSSTRRYRGTGLGLALVKEMTERMNGAVSVASVPGVGTTMTVRLPAVSGVVPDLVAPASEDPIEAMHRLAEYRGGLAVDGPDDGSVAVPVAGAPDRARVLVVDDEPDMRRYLVGILEPEYLVLQARDGAEGLRLALDLEPDLILLDLMLPQLDGLEVCRRIRTDPKHRTTRIMLLTARADEHSKLTALEHGADDFLTKPFSTVEVLTRLRNLLENARLERDLAARNLRLERALKDLETTQAQLIQSEKLNALGSLSAGLLHEINNPLNYTLTALQLLAADPAVQGDELLREIVGDINEGMQRIRVIVTDLRAFAYPSEAQRAGRLDFNEVVDAALRFSAHDLSGIEVERSLASPAPVLGSKSHLTQVLVNLLGNASKAVAATGDGRPGVIRILGETDGGRLRVRVVDNGVGMDQATLGRIFDPFFTTRDVGQGMGLGLSICHTIIGNHQGRLTASSRPGEGTELAFDLPVADGGEP